MTNWTTSTASGILNRHTRRILGPPKQHAQLLSQLAEPGNPVWPSDRWPPLVLDDSLRPGSTGGHGPVRYAVTDYRPGELLAFATTPDAGFVGTHAFTLKPVTDRTSEAVVWQHELIIESPTLFVRYAVLPMHDQLIEDLFDRSEAAIRGTSPTPRQMPVWTRLIYGLAAATERVVAIAGGRRAHGERAVSDR